MPLLLRLWCGNNAPFSLLDQNHRILGCHFFRYQRPNSGISLTKFLPVATIYNVYSATQINKKSNLYSPNIPFYQFISLAFMIYDFKVPDWFVWGWVFTFLNNYLIHPGIKPSLFVNMHWNLTFSFQFFFYKFKHDLETYK